MGYLKEKLEPIAPHLFYVTPCKKQVFILFIATLQILKHGNKGSHKSFLTWQVFCPLTIFAAMSGPYLACPHLFCLTEIKTEHNIPCEGWHVLTTVSSSSVLVMPLLIQPRISLSFFAAAHSSVTLSLMSTRTPRSLSMELLPSQMDPVLHSSIMFSQMHNFKLVEFHVVHSSSLSMSFYSVAVPFTASTPLLSLTSSANFTRVDLITSFT